MEVTTIHQGGEAYSQQLQRVGKPPDRLFIRGRPLPDIMSRPRVAVVGNRRMSPYGRHVTQQFVSALVEQGVVIVSGLAIGIDAEAHRVAIESGGLTMAVLPTPVEVPAPASNYRLAERILSSGGTLFSVYPANSDNHKGNFVARNEYVAALSDAVLVIEAGENSGSRHTVNFAFSLNVPSFAVPGNITSPNSIGTNNMLKTHTAPVTSPHDILRALNLSTPKTKRAPASDDPDEQAIIRLLVRGLSDGEELLATSRLAVPAFNRALTMLEISGKIIALGGNRWELA